MTNPIVVALDVASAAEAMSLVKRLGDSVSMYLIGLELHTAEGRGIFLDPTFYDIPEAVKRANSMVVELVVDLLKINASFSVMCAAVAGRG